MQLSMDNMSYDDEDDWGDEEEEEDYAALPEEQKGFALDFSRAKSYEILGKQDIVRRQREAIEQVCDRSGVSLAVAGALLMKHNWNISVVMQKIVDLNCFEMAALKRTLSTMDSWAKVTCVLCYSTVLGKQMRGLECQHMFCVTCFEDYAKEQVMNGMECIYATCPDSRCSSIMSEEMYKQLLPPNLFAKYKRFVVNSYIDRGVNVKWCPRPGCENACQYPKDRARDVTCLCGYSWCFKCGLEAHAPLDCETLAKWNAKNSASDDTLWIKANTKTCPRCKTPIQKNEGCMHMTCRCRHEFCWLCLGDWSEHGSATGGFYACNKFQKARMEGKYREEERERFLAEQSVKRYEHYFNRYIEHKRSYRSAIEKNKRVKDSVRQICDLMGSYDLVFLERAVDLLVECRNVVANSYAYGYYVTSPAKLQFFEFLQGDMESNLEKLDEITNKPLDGMLETEGAVKFKDEYYTWKENVNSITNSLSSYFEKITQEILANFPDVKDIAMSEDVLMDAQLLAYSRDETLKQHWSCPMCTYANVPGDTQCHICQTPRPR